MIFLIVEKAILHAIGFELVAFTTRVMPCRSKITSAPANVLPVPQTSVEDCSKPNIGSQYRHRLGKQATDWRVLIERSAGVAIDELRMVLEGVIEKSRWYFLRLSRRCQAASDITGSPCLRERDFLLCWATDIFAPKPSVNSTPKIPSFLICRTPSQVSRSLTQEILQLHRVPDVSRAVLEVDLVVACSEDNVDLTWKGCCFVRR